MILPEIMPGVLNGAIIAFTMSIDDFVISYFTKGSGVTTLAVEIYTMVEKARHARDQCPFHPDVPGACLPCCSPSTCARRGRRPPPPGKKAALMPGR